MNVLRRRKTGATAEAEPAAPRFVCRTCGASGQLYVAREVTNWTAIGQPWRTPTGDLTYRTLNGYLPGVPGPPLAYFCGNCRTSCDSLEELVIEPAFLEAMTG